MATSTALERVAKGVLNHANQGLSHQQRIAHHVDTAFRPPDTQPKRGCWPLHETA